MVKTKLELWKEKKLGFYDLATKTKPAAEDREDIPEKQLKAKIDRGDPVQEARLKVYPTIDVKFDALYAGTVNVGADEAEDKLYEIGFRNGPLAYVEVTDKFGPDDGSYWLNIVRETGKFPNVPFNRFIGPFRRIKDQIHVTIFEDNGRTHYCAHREQSSMLQPARHVAVNDANARRGIRDFRDVWFDTFGSHISTPME